MGNKIFGGVVLLLWATSMTWLVTAKILPSFLHGEPPLAEVESQYEPTAWRIELNSRPCGVAVTQAVPGAVESTEIHSRVRLEAIPLPDVAPKWMTGLLMKLGEVDLDMRTRTTLDSLGNLATFQTKIQLNDMPALIRMTGVVDNAKLRLRLRTGNFSNKVEYPWRGNRLLGGELMPDSKLVNLHVGKKWRREVYSLFGAPNSPVTAIEAEVMAAEIIYYQGVATKMHRIEYRSVASAGVAASDRLQAEVWVTEEGQVVRQDATFLNAKLRFERMSPEESRELVESMLELGRYATATRLPSDPSMDSLPAIESLEPKSEQAGDAPNL